MSASPQEFFEQTLPQAFAEAVSANPPADMEGEEMRITYDIDGEKYGVKVLNGNKLEVVPGGFDDSHIKISMAADAFPDVASASPAQTPVVQYNKKKTLDKIKNFKGNFKLSLTRDDGTKFDTSTVFNNTEEPAVKLMVKGSDWAAIQAGKLNAQMAFMTGKVKFEGSMPFLMLLGTLNQ